MEARVKRRALLLLVSCIWVPIAVLGGTGDATFSSLSRPRVANFGALFTLNSVIGSSVMRAVLAAVDDVNSDSTVLSGTKLNVLLQDTNCSGFVGTIDDKMVKVREAAKSKRERGSGESPPLIPYKRLKKKDKNTTKKNSHEEVAEVETPQIVYVGEPEKDKEREEDMAIVEEKEESTKDGVEEEKSNEDGVSQSVEENSNKDKDDDEVEVEGDNATFERIKLLSDISKYKMRSQEIKSTIHKLCS